MQPVIRCFLPHGLKELSLLSARLSCTFLNGTMACTGEKAGQVQGDQAHRGHLHQRHNFARHQKLQRICAAKSGAGVLSQRSRRLSHAGERQLQLTALQICVSQAMPRRLMKLLLCSDPCLFHSSRVSCCCLHCRFQYSFPPPEPLLFSHLRCSRPGMSAYASCLHMLPSSTRRMVHGVRL